MAGRTEHPTEIREERPPVVETATEARQARLGRPVLIVLIAGLIIAMLAWIPAEWWGRKVASDDGAAVEQTSPDITPGPQPQGAE